ncbi:MAG: ABC transporter substrate-binding protein [Chitinophagaceae bacterium]|nr:ABC transporter substrate-binding protein [Chitinophagaceae bacterium]
MILTSAGELGFVPKRIISLVPSQTELLYDLGLEDETVGITKFCIHPDAWSKNKTRVGGTKTVNQAVIDGLRPDLIIANKEENVKEQVEALAAEYPVWLTDVNNLEDALQMIRDIGTLTNRKEQAEWLAESIRKEFVELQQLQTKNYKLTTAYLIWKDPYMAAGGGTFIHDMIRRCGFRNIFADLTRYPEVRVTELQTAGCELLLLSSEPFPFREKDLEELAEQLPGTRILLVDGEMFSWYGSRLREAPAYFNQLIHRLL